MKQTVIQWCDSTLNLLMGCTGCELWPTSPAPLVQALLRLLGTEFRARVEESVAGWTPQQFVRQQKDLGLEVADLAGEPGIAQRVEAEINRICRCYAGRLHARFGGRTKGFAPDFNSPEIFSGRMNAALGKPAH